MLRTSTLCFAILILAASLTAQTTAFNFQGNLKSGGSEANGSYDFEFALFDALNSGTQVGTTLTRNNVTVTSGTFTVSLDFGNQFPASNRFLEIRVRPTGGGSFTTLAPRQSISSTPYAVKSLVSDSSTTASNATQLGGLAANQYVVTTDPRMTDARPPTAGSGNYVQNSVGQQANSNFNVSGNGTAGGTLSANNVNSTFEYKIGGQTFLNSVGTNTSFGVETGSANFGLSNTYSGYRAGLSATSNASNNSFFGARAGRSNSNGLDNSFFGNNSGELNTFGGFNAFFGSNSGAANINGNRNSFFGVTAGRDNIGGSDNSFFGSTAGQANQSGGSNTFVGGGSGVGNTTGSSNTFVGRDAGLSNISGNANTAIGSAANFGANNLVNATAIGAGAIVSTNNTVVLGRAVDTVQIPGTLVVTGAISGTASSATNASQLGGIAANQYVTTTTGNASYIQNSTTQQTGSNFNISGTGKAAIIDASQYKIGGERVVGTFGSSTHVGIFAGQQLPQASDLSNTFIGNEAGSLNFTAGTVLSENVFTGWKTGRNVSGDSNTFYGTQAGNQGNGSPVLMSGNSLFGTRSNVGPGVSGSTAIGVGSFVSRSNSVVLGATGINVGIGTTAPNFRLHVRADGQDGIKLQHTGVGAFPQIRWTDSNDTSKASIGVDTSGTGSMNFFVNGADRMILKSNGVVQVPGTIFINNPNTLVITSPNGACWGITVSNAGVLSTFPVTPCP